MIFLKELEIYWRFIGDLSWYKTNILEIFPIFFFQPIISWGFVWPHNPVGHNVDVVST